MLGAIMTIPCGYKWAASGVAGAAVARLGFDEFLTKKWGVPPLVHWALAGMAVDGACHSPDAANDNYETLRSAGFGVLGALVVTRCL